MGVIYPFDGKEDHLQRIIDSSATVEIRLFKNNFTPDNDTVFGDFDECDFSGYGWVGSGYGAITENGDGNAETVLALCSFAHDGGGTANDVYGWWMTAPHGGANDVWFCERFADAPRTMATLGDIINVTPAITQGDCP